MSALFVVAEVSNGKLFVRIELGSEHFETLEHGERVLVLLSESGEVVEVKNNGSLPNIEKTVSKAGERQ